MTVAYQTRERIAICAYCGNEFRAAKNTKTCSYECQERRKIQKENLEWVKRKPIDERKLNPNSFSWANPFRRPNYRRREEYDPTGVLDDG